MSETPTTVIDEDRIVLLYNQAMRKAATLKAEYQEVISLCNQLAGISKNKNGELPMSALTKTAMDPKLREYIYKECIIAATRNNIS